jgi:PKD repeat protein
VGESKELTLNGIPAGKYTGVKFIIGVDSARSTMDVSKRTGDLDPAAGGSDMYWSWNSGYIFYKIEGTSPQSTEMGNMFMYHIGGYGGYSSAVTNNIRSVSLTAPEAIEVGKDRAPEVHMYADVLEAFKTPVTYSIAAGAMVHMPMDGAVFANNYADMFTINHVHNE